MATKDLVVSTTYKSLIGRKQTPLTGTQMLNLDAAYKHVLLQALSILWHKLLQKLIQATTEKQTKNKKVNK